MKHDSSTDSSTDDLTSKADSIQVMRSPKNGTPLLHKALSNYSVEQRGPSVVSPSSSTKSDASSNRSSLESPASTTTSEPYNFETIPEAMLGDVGPIVSASKSTELAGNISVTRRNASINCHLQQAPKSPVPPSDGSPAAQGALHRSFSARFMSMAVDTFMPRSQSAKL